VLPVSDLCFWSITAPFFDYKPERRKLTLCRTDYSIRDAAIHAGGCAVIANVMSDSVIEPDAAVECR